MLMRTLIDFVRVRRSCACKQPDVCCACSKLSPRRTIGFSEAADPGEIEG